MSKKNKLKKENTVKHQDKSVLLSFKPSEKLRVGLGLVFLLSSVFLFFAILSYFFTWKTDQAKILTLNFVDFLDATPVFIVQNWMGKLGAKLAHVLVYDSLGLSAFCVPFFLFYFGFFLLSHQKLKIYQKKYLYLSLALWSSVFLGFVFGKNQLVWAGAWGYQSSIWLQEVFGLGTVFVLIFALSIIILFSTELSLNELVEKFKQNKQYLSISGQFKSSEIFKSQKTKTLSEVFSTSKNHIVATDSLKERHFPNLDNMPDFKEEHSNHLAENLVAKEDNFLVHIPVGDAVNEKTAASLVQEFGEYDPTADLSNYHLPNLDLLKNYPAENQVTNKELEINKNRIIETLKNYNIPIKEISATVGPTITLYEIVPAPGIRIAKIKSLEDDIALNLAALGIRIIAPMPGKGTVGIEVPNEKPQIVAMRSMLGSEKFVAGAMELPLVLGRTISNETFVVDLTKMPHLLIAGATGQGKSVGINAIIMSLLYKKHPSQMKFVFVDPKKVELSLYSKIERHFLAKLDEDEEAIVTDTSKVVKILNALCKEMDERYELLKEAQCKNIKEYNAKFTRRVLNPLLNHRFLPYIVLVIDEFADLIMTAGKEVEMPIARLAQLARAIGIHLIVATQRPSVNVITGVIKANFPARIAFRVMSQVDSKTILDSTGAERLVGRGDLLYTSGNEPMRLQCGFIDTPEVEAVVDYIGAQQAYSTAYYLPEIQDESSEDSHFFDAADRDHKFAEAARLIVATQQGSTSLIQRKLKLGYNRAGRIIDQLEAAGIVGPFEGSKSRRVLVLDEASLNKILKETES